METPNIAEKEFREFLNEEYLFPNQVQEDDDEPIILNDGIYYGNNKDNIFRFEVKRGEVISLRDIESEEIHLEDIENPNSGIDSLFQNWLTDSASENYARRWIISFCKNTEVQSLSKPQRIAIGEMFKYANAPSWIRCFEQVSSLDIKDKEQAIGCKFILTAIKSGIFPWDSE